MSRENKIDGMEIKPMVWRNRHGKQVSKEVAGGYEDCVDEGDDLSKATWWLMAHQEGGGLIDLAAFDSRKKAERGARAIAAVTGWKWFIDL